MKVICLDPGVITGYAVGVIDPNYKEPMGVISGQEKWNELGLYNNLVYDKPDIIVYEEFEYRSEQFYGKGAYYKVELYSRNLIGVIELYVQQRFEKSLHENDQSACARYTQKPAKALGDKNHFGRNSVLKEHSVYKVDRPHANDAMRHLLTWYTFGPGFQYDKNKKGFRQLA